MILKLLFRSVVSAWRHDQFGTAKAAAFSALVAFFPLLATTAAVFVRVRAEFASQTLQHFLAQVLPPGAADLVFKYLARKGAQPVLLPLTAMALSVWAAGGVVTSLMQGFRATYGLSRARPFPADTLVAVLLVISAVGPVLGASALVLLGARAERWAAAGLGLLPAGVEMRGWVFVLGGLVRYVVAISAIVVGAAMLYYFGPNRRQHWRFVWPGAVLATALCLGATSLFAWYARNLANYNVMYGSIAAVIALLMWMYLLAVIALVGCEFSAAYEKLRRGS
jgi:membrane protein